MIAWLKGLPFIKAAGVFLAAVLFALAAGAVARRETSAKRLDNLAQKNAITGATKQLEKAVIQTNKAEAHRNQARHAAMKAETRLDTIGATDESLATLISDWNSKRLRDN